MHRRLSLLSDSSGICVGVYFMQQKILLLDKMRTIAARKGITQRRAKIYCCCMYDAHSLVVYSTGD